MCESYRITWGHEARGVAVREDFRNLLEITGDDGSANRHVLENLGW